VAQTYDNTSNTSLLGYVGGVPKTIGSLDSLTLTQAALIFNVTGDTDAFQVKQDGTAVIKVDDDAGAHSLILGSATAGDLSWLGTNDIDFSAAAGTLSLGSAASNLVVGNTMTSTGLLTAGGGLTVTGNATISGDLTVGGDTLTVNTSTMTVEDNTIVLADGPSAVTDAGVLVERYQSDGANDIGNLGSFSAIDQVVGDTLQVGGSTTTAKLHAGASAHDDYYNGMWIKFTAGAQNDKVRQITDYNGTTKIATLSGDALSADPGAAGTETFEIYTPYAGFIYEDSANVFYFGRGVANSTTSLVNGTSNNFFGLTVNGLTSGKDGDANNADSTWYSTTSGDWMAWDASAAKLSILGTAAATALDVASGNVLFGASGAGSDVTFYSDTAGDLMVWDASAAKLTITGTDGSDALVVLDGDVGFGSDGGTAQTVSFYSSTAGDAMVWDGSAKKLTITGTDAHVALDVADGQVLIQERLSIGASVDTGYEFSLNGHARLFEDKALYFGKDAAQEFVSASYEGSSDTLAFVAGTSAVGVNFRTPVVVSADLAGGVLDLSGAGSLGAFIAGGNNGTSSTINEDKIVSNAMWTASATAVATNTGGYSVYVHEIDAATSSGGAEKYHLYGLYVDGSDGINLDTGYKSYGATINGSDWDVGLDITGNVGKAITLSGDPTVGIDISGNAATGIQIGAGVTAALSIQGGTTTFNGGDITVSAGNMAFNNERSLIFGGSDLTIVHKDGTAPGTLLAPTAPLFFAGSYTAASGTYGHATIGSSNGAALATFAAQGSSATSGVSVLSVDLDNLSGTALTTGALVGSMVSMQGHASDASSGAYIGHLVMPKSTTSASRVGFQANKGHSNEELTFGFQSQSGAFLHNVTSFSSAPSAIGHAFAQQSFTWTDNSTAQDATAAQDFSIVRLVGGTIESSNTGVTTNKAATLRIDNAPADGGNNTATEKFALYVAAGATLLQGAVKMGSTLEVSGTSTFTGVADFDAGLTVAAGQAITGDGALTLGVAAGAYDLSLKMGDAAGAQKVLFKDSAGATVASVDSDGLGSFASFYLPGGEAITATGISNDTTLAGNSQVELVTEYAVKQYVDAQAAGGFTASDGTNTSTISGGDTFTFTDSDGISAVVTPAGDTITFSLDASNGAQNQWTNATHDVNASGLISFDTSGGAITLSPAAAAGGDLTMTAGDEISLVMTDDVSATNRTFTQSGLNTGAGVTTWDVDFDVIDIDATGAITIDAGAGLSLDAAAASNFSTSSGDLTLAASAHSVVISGAEAAADAVRIVASNAAGGIDIDAGATSGALTANGGGAATFTFAGINLAGGSSEIDLTTTGALDLNSGAGTWDSSAGIALEAATASSFNVTTGALTLSTTTSGDLTLSTTTAGDILVSSAAEIDLTGQLIDINAGANLDIDVTGTFDMLATGAFSIDGTGASNVSADTGNLTLSTTTSGNVVVNAVQLLDLDGATVDITSAGTLDINQGGAGTWTTGAHTLTIGDDNAAGAINIGTAGARAITVGSSSAASVGVQSTADVTLTTGADLILASTGEVATETGITVAATNDGDILAIHTDGTAVQADANTHSAIFGSWMGSGNEVCSLIGKKVKFANNPTGWTVGTVLYLSETPGEVTPTAPTTAGAHVIRVGILQDATAGAGNGRMIYLPQYMYQVAA
jgi:hypothetical protein